MIRNKKAFFDSMKATMTIIGSLAMTGSVIAIRYDKNLALALALGGGFTLMVEKFLPSIPRKETNNNNVEHKFQTFDLKRGTQT